MENAQPGVYLVGGALVFHGMCDSSLAAPTGGRKHARMAVCPRRRSSMELAFVFLLLVICSDV